MGHLEEILASVLEMGYAATWVILAVLLLRVILQRMPKKYSYMLWAIPAVRLLIPIPFAGVWGLLCRLPEGGLGRALYQAASFLSHPGGIGSLLAGYGAPGGTVSLLGNGSAWAKAVQAGSHAVSHAAGLAGMAAREAGAGGEAGIGPGLVSGGHALGRLRDTGAGSMMARGMQAGAGGHASLSLMQAAAILWVMGVSLYLAWYVSSYLRVRRKLRGSMRQEGNVYLADGIRQPFTLAGFPDRIYLPSSLCMGEASNILRHERVHIRRKDPWLNILSALILGVYWFHPLVWAGVHYFRRDMEMSCDEAAVAGMDAEGVKGYVLDMLRFSAGRGQWLQFPCGFGEKGVVGRAMNLKKEKIGAKAALCLAGALVAGAAILLIPDARGDLVGGAALGVPGSSHRDGAAGIGSAIQAAGAVDTGPAQEASKAASSQQGVLEPQGMQGTQGQERPQDLEGALEQYFTGLYSALSDGTKGFTQEDFASTDGYMVGKRLVGRRHIGDALYGGISNVRLKKIEIQEESEEDGRIRARVQVVVLFDYGIYSRLPEKGRSEEAYDIYDVSAVRDGDRYKILDISSASGCYERAREALAAEGIPDIRSNYAAVDAYFDKMQAYQEFLEGYFMELHSALLDDTKNFSHDDFASTNGYIIGRQIMAKRYSAHVLYGGYAAVKLEEVDIESISEMEDEIEVMAYIRHSYSYGSNPKGFTGEGDIFRISLIPDGGSYKVLDLDITSEIKKLVNDYWEAEDIPNPESNYTAVDTFFEGIEENADDIRRNEIEQKKK